MLANPTQAPVPQIPQQLTPIQALQAQNTPLNDNAVRRQAEAVASQILSRRAANNKAPAKELLFKGTQTQSEITAAATGTTANITQDKPIKVTNELKINAVSTPVFLDGQQFFDIITNLKQSDDTRQGLESSR